MSYYIFPGCFDPPHKGHVNLLYHFASMFPHIMVVCSSNPSKHSAWFSPEESVDMWLSYSYMFHKANINKIEILTFNAASQIKYNDNIVLLKGIRQESDLLEFNEMAKLNFNNLKIKDYYLYWDESNPDISSTYIRGNWNKPELIRDMVSYEVLEKLQSRGELRQRELSKTMG